MLANSLKESVAAQSKVVDKLFDEMKELSRKVDERKAPQQPMPPIVVNMQQPGAARSGGSQQPIMMDLPSHGPQPEGFPRYATADAGESEEEGEAQPLAEEPEPEEEQTAPTKRPPTPERRAGSERRTQPSRPVPADRRAGPDRRAQPDRRSAPPPPAPPVRPASAPSPVPEDLDDGEVTLEEIAEELEPAEETGEALPGPEPAPPPKGWPGLQPVTDSEPEPEIESAPTEQGEAELEPLGDASPAAGESGPRPSPPDASLAPGARSSDDVRKELRDYLNGVRDRLDKGEGTPSSPVDLLDYLGKLSDYLPEREKKRFRGSNERLAMESLKARLAGKRGLRQKVADSYPAAKTAKKQAMTRSRVVDTFSYLKDLAAWHPDKAVGAAMRDRIESIVARMGRSG